MFRIPAKLLKSKFLILITDKVKKCIRALEAAETDTEKFATLFLVPKLVQGTECSKEARLSLMKVSSNPNSVQKKF